MLESVGISKDNVDNSAFASSPQVGAGTDPGDVLGLASGPLGTNVGAGELDGLSVGNSGSGGDGDGSGELHVEICMRRG